MLALTPGASVVPVTIKGLHEALPFGQALPKLFCEVHVHFEKSRQFPKTDLKIIPNDILSICAKAIVYEINNLLESE